MRGILTRMRDRRASSRGRGGGLSTRLGRGERRRRSLRLSLGLSVFGALLALGLLGMLVLGATVFFETRALEKRGHLAAVQLAVLAEAAASHAHSRFPALLTQAQGGPSELTVAGLKAAGALPQEFSETDALGRGYRVLMLAAGADAFDLLVTETVGPGDTVRPAAAPLQATGPRIGLAGPSRLSGPTVDADVSAFRAAFAGAPGEGALAALRRFDHGGVFGDALYRVAIPGFAEANRMEADLDMGGNAIEGAGTVEAARLEVETDVEAGGDLTVTGDLVVGRALRVAGAVEASERITVGAARIEGAVSSDSLTAAGAVRARTVEAAGLIEAGSIGAAGAVAAGSARLTSLDAAAVTARTVTAGTVSASSANAARMRFDGRLDADSAGISRLIVGRCQGCR
ncbi:MAG: shufflon system plasmid conjugative transfer pilus tip adhesin PilV [Rhodospirillales bacterium]|nr:shufflon system plasmid conjugative transfer pilus tip adhesin PilV [Rhodospirillales bacterium]